MFFSNVTKIEQNVFAINFNSGNFSLQTLFLSGKLTYLDGGAFANHKGLSKVYIGSESSPSQLKTVGDAPFRGCAVNCSAFDITYYYSTGKQYTDAMLVSLKAQLSVTVAGAITTTGKEVKVNA